MPRSLLSPLRDVYEASPPLVGADELRALLNNRSSHTPLPWYRTFQSRQLLGILMTLLGILALGYLLLPSHLLNDATGPVHPQQTIRPTDPSSQDTTNALRHSMTDNPSSDTAPRSNASDRRGDAQTSRCIDRATTHADKVRGRSAPDDAQTASAAAPAVAARPESSSAASAVRERDAGPSMSIEAMQPSSIPAVSPNDIHTLPASAIMPGSVDIAFPESDGHRELDSIRAARDSVWNYAGVYMTSFFTPRSFSELNLRLGAKGFPALRSSVFGSGLSYEFARPGRDSAVPITFPVFLYPAKPFYTPGVTIEWAIQPEAASADGSRRASFSMWTLLADNNFYLRTYRTSRFLLTLSFGVSFSSITLGREASFDDLIGGADPGVLSLSRSSFFIQPSLRYDVCFAGLQFGLSAGYSLALTQSSWRMRSSLQFDPGLAVAGGPDDSAGGFHLGFSLTLRGLESMMPSR